MIWHKENGREVKSFEIFDSILQQAKWGLDDSAMVLTRPLGSSN